MNTPESRARDGAFGGHPFPILQTFARARPVKGLGGFRELSHLAGREGDDFDQWSAELADAFEILFPVERAKNPMWRSIAAAAILEAFRLGVEQRLHADFDPDNLSPDALDAARFCIDEAPIRLIFCLDHRAIDCAIGDLAGDVAALFDVTAAEAARAALLGFKAAGAARGVRATALALNAAYTARQKGAR